jgi:acyl carrier protein
MTKKREIIEIIFKSIEELNQQDETSIPMNVHAKLFGKDSDLDSVGLVNLITTIEEQIEKSIGKYIPIADERAMSLESSPFKTVETLTNYIEILINE